MIDLKHIPNEAVEAAHLAFEDTMGTDFHLSWARSIAAALNAWPNVEVLIGYCQDRIVLPLPQNGDT